MRVAHTISPTISATSPYGRVSAGDRKPAIQRFTPEAAADYHAQFGGDVFSLIDQVSGLAFEPLAVDGSAGTPVFKANSVVTADTVITCSVANGVMTVTALAGRPLAVGMVVNGPGITPGNTIASLGTGTGGLGTYNLTTSDNGSAAERNCTSIFGGILCPWADQVNETMVIVFANPSIASNAVVVGDYASTDTAAGWYIRATLNGFTQRARPASGATTLTLPANHTTGSWLCAVITEDVNSQRVMIDGVNIVASAAPRVASPRRRSLGNRWIADLTYQTGLEVAECLRIPSTVSAAEQANLFVRAKTRAAARGQTVLTA